MAFNGSIGIPVSMPPGTGQILYFGPFGAGDLIRSVILRIADAAQAGRGEFTFDIAEFEATTAPAATAAMFGIGRSRFSGLMTMMYPSTQENEVAVALNVLVESGTKFVGVSMLNLDGTDTIQGGLFVDVVPANVGGRLAGPVRRRPRPGPGDGSNEFSSVS